MPLYSQSMRYSRPPASSTQLPMRLSLWQGTFGASPFRSTSALTAMTVFFTVIVNVVALRKVRNLKLMDMA